MSEAFTNEDEAAVTSAAKILTNRYRGIVEYEDVRQECYVWLLENHSRVQQWREDRTEEAAQKSIVASMRNAVDRYCRKEKANAEGYSPEDEFFYSIPQVAELLRTYFDPDWMVPGGIVYDDRTTGGRPPSEGGNLMAMVADVGRAYEDLPAHDRTVLREVYGSGEPADNISVLAVELGISFTAAEWRVRRVVGRLREKLGGPSPWA